MSALRRLATIGAFPSSDRLLLGDDFQGADVGSGSGCDGRPLGLIAGKLTSEVRCSEAAAGGRLIPTHHGHPKLRIHIPNADVCQLDRGAPPRSVAPP